MSDFTEFLARKREHKITHRVEVAEAGVDAGAHARVAGRLVAIIPEGTAVAIGEGNPHGEDADYWPAEDYTYGVATWEVQGELP
jgi:hypothetical protein